MNKLGIFLFNGDNFIEKYVKYILEDIAPNLSHLCIVADKSESNLKDVFARFSDDIFFNNGHENIDIWREVIVNHIGFDKLVTFDEIILFDDSFFGPIYSFKEIFYNMNDVDCDLWTIFSNGLDDELTSSNIQFITFRKNLIKSEDFKEFWVDVDNKSLKKKNNENYLINYFSKLGYNWKNYLFAINNLELNKQERFFSIFDIYNLIKNYEFPLINIKPFTLPKKVHLNYHNGLDLSLTMNYLNMKTDYDVSLIYEYLLKIIDPNALVNLLNLKKVIPRENLNNNYKSDKSIVVIAHIYYDDLLDYDFKFLRNIPDYIDIVITTDEIDKKVLIEQNYLSRLDNNSKVILIESRGRDMSALFVGCKDIVDNYDYFCFVHDKKSSYNDISLIGNSFRDLLWENTLASEDYINSIIKSFDDNDCLGLIAPPRVYHSTYFTAFYHGYWLANVNEVKKLFNKMKINTELDSKEIPLTIGNCYWGKYDALKPLFDLNLNYEDFSAEPMPHDGTISHALERIYAHVAASQGFYTEIVMTADYASNELTNYPYMLDGVLKIIQNRFDKKISVFEDYTAFLKRFNKNLNSLDKSIMKKDKEINEIMNSNSWKITKSLRRFSFKFKSLKRKFKK